MFYFWWIGLCSGNIIFFETFSSATTLFQLIDVGFFVCFDSFLSLLTIMPTRILITLWRLLTTRLAIILWYIHTYIVLIRMSCWEYMHGNVSHKYMQIDEQYLVGSLILQHHITHLKWFGFPIPVRNCVKTILLFLF